MSEDLSIPPHRERAAYEAFVDEFARESDRAAVVLGAAKLDLQLYLILKKVLVPNPGATDELLDGEGPLATFNSKINFCYRLGLIDQGLARSLHLIRRIRNSFAHEISGADLASGAHRDRVRELVATFISLEAFQSFKKANQERWKFEEGPRLDFRIILAIVGARLEGHYFSVEKCYHDAPAPLIPKKWVKKKTTV